MIRLSRDPTRRRWWRSDAPHDSDGGSVNARERPQSWRQSAAHRINNRGPKLRCNRAVVDARAHGAHSPSTATLPQCSSNARLGHAGRSVQTAFRQQQKFADGKPNR